MVKVGNYEVSDEYFDRIIKRCNAKIEDWRGRELKDKSECWIWTGQKDKEGYALTTVNKRLVRVVKAYWAQNHRDGLGYNEYLKHNCGNRICVNPSHLYIQIGRDRIIKTNEISALMEDVPKKDKEKVASLARVLRSAFRGIDDSRYGKFIELRFAILMRCVLDLHRYTERPEAARALRNPMWFLDDVDVSADWVRSVLTKYGYKI